MAELFWLDMEMTGLDVEKEVPIEVAAVVTGWDLKVLDSYHTIIKQPQKFISGMDDWNTKHHGESGLTALIPSGKDPGVVDKELAAFATKYFGENRAILTGNSISQDRLFVRRYMPLLEAKLHYRIVDVTSWKVIFNGRYNRKFAKKDGHRALDDIHESIAELKFYMEFIKEN